MSNLEIIQIEDCKSLTVVSDELEDAVKEKDDSMEKFSTNDEIKENRKILQTDQIVTDDSNSCKLNVINDLFKSESNENILSDENETDSDLEEYTLAFFDSDSDVRTVLDEKEIVDNLSDCYSVRENDDDNCKKIISNERDMEMKNYSSNDLIVSLNPNDEFLQENNTNEFNREKMIDNCSNDLSKDDTFTTADFEELENLEILDIFYQSNDEQISIDLSVDSELNKFVLEEEEEKEKEEEEEDNNLIKQDNIVEVGKRLEKLASMLFENSSESRLETFDDMLYYLNSEDAITVMNMKEQVEMIEDNHAKTLATLLDSARYKSEEEVNEISQKIIQQKRKIKDSKKESLKDLAVEFLEFEELLMERKTIAEVDNCENSQLDDDELEESVFENQRSPFMEMPLTKDEVTENYRIKVMEKDLKNIITDVNAKFSNNLEVVNEEESESHDPNVDIKKEQDDLINLENVSSEEKSIVQFIEENFITGVIESTFNSMIDDTLELPDNDPTSIIKNKEIIVTDEDKNYENNLKTGETIQKQSENEELKDSTKTNLIETVSPSNENSQTPIDEKIVNKIDDSYESLLADFAEKENRPYIKGKVYDYDEKKHGVRMTEKFIKKHCKEHKLYQTPWLNDVLYLHYKGFTFIENLEKYTGLITLWLESNGIREIANLENQSELKCLYLHHNIINKIENLEYLTKLDTLNLAHNMIRKIENLDSLKYLNTLNLSYNFLQSRTDIEHLRSLEYLSILDLSHNRIDTFDIVDVR
ncbi:hypothetical protein M0802_010765 [Mischocyttarus mexicanus]|nr:hypothetical protein M0802_010765 [Mischocyttarus mexicanus]